MACAHVACSENSTHKDNVKELQAIVAANEKATSAPKAAASGPSPMEVDDSNTASPVDSELEEAVGEYIRLRYCRRVFVGVTRSSV